MKETKGKPRIQPVDSKPIHAAEVRRSAARTVAFATLAFLIPLMVYVRSTAPTVSTVDSGELTLAAWDFGVAHPPGFPLYTMLAHPWSRLPWRNPAYGINLFSACCAAAAMVVLWFAARWWLAGASRWRRSSPNSPRNPVMLAWAVDGAALLAILTLAFTFIVWGFAAVAEIYSLNLLCMACMFAALFAWLRDPQRTRRRLVFIATVSLGLGLGVHHVTVALTAPGLLYLFLSAPGPRQWRWRLLLPLFIVVVMVVAALYGSLAWRAACGPVFNWGRAVNLQRLWWHLTGKQYQVYLFSASFSRLMATASTELWRIVQHLFRQWTPLGFVLLAIGGYSLWSDRKRFVAVLLFCGFNILYSMIYEISEDKEAYYITSFVMGAFCIAEGMLWLAYQAYSRRRMLATAWLAFLALPGLTLIKHWHDCDRSVDTRATMMLDDLSAELPKGALLITMEWEIFSPWLYRRHVENFRPDLRIVDVNLMRRTWYMDYLRAQYPELMNEVREEDRLFSEQLYLFEYGRPYDGPAIQQHYLNLLNRLIDVALSSGGCHVTFPLEPGIGAHCKRVPWGLTFKLTPKSDASLEPPERAPQGNVAQWLYGEDDLGGKKVQWLYTYMTTSRALWYKEHGEQDKIGRLPRRLIANGLMPYPSK